MPSTDAIDLRPPPRRAGSIRRTTSIDVTFPDGVTGRATFDGRTRDILTNAAGEEPVTLDKNRLAVDITASQKITRFETDPTLADVQCLIGKDSLFGMRRRLEQAGIGKVYGRGLSHLLDDLVPCSLIRGWVWFKWEEDRAALHEQISYQEDRVNICAGYVPGSPQFTSKAFLDEVRLIPPVEECDDPHALHPLPAMTGARLRRLRRYDLWREEDGVHIDAMWEDCATLPDGARAAVHQYRLFATISHDGERLLAIDATPGILPNRTCHAAPGNIAMVLDIPVRDLDHEVLHRMRGPHGCTHLNDAVRGLGRLGPLIDRLEAAD